MKLRLTSLLVLATAVVLVVVAPAGARQPGVSVSGELTNNDAGTPSDPSDDYSVFSGSLIGKQSITSEDFRYDPLTGTVIAWGTERFEGCLDRNRNAVCGAGDPGGTIDFAFVYWAQLDPVTFALLSGQCVHPITAGTGGFAGVLGTITMKDTPQPDGSVVTTYKGKIQLAGPAARRPAAQRSQAAVSVISVAPAAAQRHVC